MMEKREQTIVRVSSVYAFLFLVVTIVVFVLMGITGHNQTFWWSYMFVTLSIGIAIVSTVINLKKGFRFADAFFGYPILRWNVIYIVVELGIAIVFFVVSKVMNPVKLCFTIQFLVTCFFIVINISCHFTKKLIEGIETTTKEKTMYIKQLKVEIDTIGLQASSHLLKELIHSLGEVVRYSDPMSHEKLQKVEQDIMLNVTLLSNYVNTNQEEEAKQTIKTLENLLIQRNNQCKLFK